MFFSEDFTILRDLLPFIHHRYVPNLKIIGLELTTRCNLFCFNCEASCRQAPSDEQLSVEQVEKFVQESISNDWNWELIKLRGGEPTLHPQLFEILEVVKRYKNHRPSCKIRLQTNGCGEKIQEVLRRLPEWVEVQSSGKDNKKPPLFSTYNIAPKDKMLYRLWADFTKGCWRTQICNITLSRYGYYPCSPGAHVARVLGMDIAVKRLALVSVESMSNQFKHLCPYCGHFREPNELVTQEAVSPLWEKAYREYKKKKPKLSLYS